MSEQPEETTFSEIKIAIVVAIVIGICLACAIIIFDVRTERFSAVYVNPDTYSNYPENGTISFTYGINSNELEKTELYDLHQGWKYPCGNQTNRV